MTAQQVKDELRVMLVDDDMLLLEELQSLICWQKSGCTLVGTFNSAKSALSHAKELLPDVVITDIRMPQMDGLDFAKALRTVCPTAKVLLLTAYSDFDYARRAVELGVSGYILKHELNSELLSQRLRQLSAELHTQSDQMQAHRRQLFESILLPPPLNSQSEQAFLQEFCPHKEQYAMYLVLFRRFTPFWGTPLPDSAQRSTSSAICSRVQHALQELAADIAPKSICIPWSNGQALALLCFPGIVSQLQQQQLVYKILTTLTNCVSPADLQSNCTLCSDACCRPSEVYPALEQLLTVRERCVFFGNQRILFANQLNFVSEISCDTQNQLHSNLEQSLHSGECAEAFSALHRYFLFAQQKMSMTALRFCVQCMRALLEKRLRTEQMGPYIIDSFISQMPECVCPTQLWELFELFYHRAEALPYRSYSARVALMIKTIQERYAEDLTLRQLADELGLNEEYLNKLFRKEVGCGFSHYLTDYRMDIARQLLKSGQWRVNEVAQKVGYKNSQYFSITFHRITGQSPSKYCGLSEDLL